MTLPNFLVIGAAKSGTSSLYKYLAAHPQIFMSPVKEPRFFAVESDPSAIGQGEVQERVWEGTVTSFDAYQALFAEANGHPAVGEASPLYLWSPHAAGAIHRRIPDVKLIACLRHPVERAFSHFLHNLRIGLETHTRFEDALEADARRHYTEYIGQGMYHRLLNRYYERFDPSRIRVYFFDDLKREPETVMRDIYRFLGVDESFRPDTQTKYNVGQRTVKDPKIERFISAGKNALRPLRPLMPNSLIRVLKGTAHRAEKIAQVTPELSPATRSELCGVFREDVLRLEKRTGRDLSAWLA